MPKRHYILAVACYLLIPVVIIAGAGLFQLIDPEMARGQANYTRNYQMLELARTGALMAAGGLALVLWITAFYLVLESRQRSPYWLALAVGGPLGFIVIAMLEDKSPAPNDRYQQFIRTLKIYWRVPFEIAVFVSVWVLAFCGTLLKRELLISYESFRTGTPAATIIARQDASSGMLAFSQWLEVLYLVVLLYLFWPVLFNLAGQIFKPRTNPA